jgi:hypothetical protein
MSFAYRLSLLLLACIATACGDASLHRKAPEAVVPLPDAPPAADEQASSAPPDAASPDPLARPAVDAAAGAPMLVRTGLATVQVDSLDAAVARVRAVARSVGGYVAGSSVQGGRDEVRQATLELKVPAARWDQAVAALVPIGRVETVSVQAEDVGEEFVDVRAREANARRLEERLVRLLDTRTGKLEEVLKVEHELARVREEIERYEGRLRFLSTRAALSTLNLRLHEPLPVAGGQPGAGVLGEAFQDALRNAVSFVTGLTAALGWLVPGALIVYLVWRLVRRAAGRLWRARPEVAGPTKLVIRRPKRPNLKVE